MKKCISQNNLKSVYLENNTAIKVFSKDYNKSDVLYEALNTARVEDAGVNIPKLLSVSVNNGQWEITSEYADGITLTQLIKLLIISKKWLNIRLIFKRNPTRFS